MFLDCLTSPHYLSVFICICLIRLLEKKIKEIFIFLLGEHLNKHEKRSEQWRSIKTESPHIQTEFHERKFRERSVGPLWLLCNSLKFPLQQSASLTQNTFMFPFCSQLYFPLFSLQTCCIVYFKPYRVKHKRMCERAISVLWDWSMLEEKANIMRNSQMYLLFFIIFLKKLR